MRCAVCGCNVDNQAKNFDKNIRFFTFPKDEKYRKEWIRLCKRDDAFNVKTARMCSIHVNQEDYVRNLKYELLGYMPRNGSIRALKEDAIPSKHLPARKDKSNSERCSRYERRKRKECNTNFK